MLPLCENWLFFDFFCFTKNQFLLNYVYDDSLKLLGLQIFFLRNSSDTGFSKNYEY